MKAYVGNMVRNPTMCHYVMTLAYITIKLLVGGMTELMLTSIKQDMLQNDLINCLTDYSLIIFQQ